MATFDSLLVGAGPIGIEIGVALKRAGLPYLHIEAGGIGATIAWYAPATSIFSSPDRLAIAGVPFVIQPQTKATREDYLAYLRAVASQFDLDIRTNHRLVSVRRNASGEFECTIADSLHGVGGPEELAARRHLARPIGEPQTLRVKRLILATGDMNLPNLLDIPGEFEPGVSHYFSDPHECYRKRCVIVGAKNSAAEAVIRLARVEAKITVCHRRQDFDDVRIKPWLMPEIRSLISEKRVKFVPNVTPRRIEAGRLFVQSTDSTTRELEFDRLFLLTGYRQDNSLFQSLGVELHGAGQIPRFDPATMETNVPGVFVAGTASAGTQLGGVSVFVENCHIHAKRICAAIRNETHMQATEPDRPIEFREI